MRCLTLLTSFPCHCVGVLWRVTVFFFSVRKWMSSKIWEELPERHPDLKLDNKYKSRSKWKWSWNCLNGNKNYFNWTHVEESRQKDKQKVWFSSFCKISISHSMKNLSNISSSRKMAGHDTRDNTRDNEVSTVSNFLWSEIQKDCPEHEAHVLFIDVNCSSKIAKSTSSPHQREYRSLEFQSNIQYRRERSHSATIIHTSWRETRFRKSDLLSLCIDIISELLTTREQSIFTSRN